MRSAWMASLATIAVALCGCDDSSGNAATGDGSIDGDAAMVSLPDGNTVGGGDGNTTMDAGSPSPDASPFDTTDGGRVQCKDGEACACDNGQDDDGDGKIDAFDPECTGPFDDDEGSFATGIPGDNKDDCQDCFFDGNSGSGDDGCQYATACIDPSQSVPSGGMANSPCHNCETSSKCEDFCTPRTPNGCDCFGCCTVERENGDTVNVFLGSGEDCSVSNLDACDTCDKSDMCENECGTCELCLGKTEEDLPESCFDGGGTDGGTGSDGGTTGGHACDDGSEPCSESDPCPSDEFCQTGCCQPTLF